MLLRKEISHATDLDLLTVIIGDRKNATNLYARAKFSLSALLNSEPQQNGDLFCAEGSTVYGDDPLIKIKAAVELAARSLIEQLQSREGLTSPAAVRDFLRLKLAALPHEVFVCIYLDAQHRVIAYEELFRGTLTQTSVYPREVVKAALRANAAAIIFAHNHPSGVPQPSRSDELLTRDLREALSLVEVKVLDHFIVAGTQALSFAERGLL
ncbi:MAG TPA: DNA repair protein RadC [Burkholderiales bacterium]|nr:DNA repair protein RadC [Burkholderiales bacterium]